MSEELNPSWYRREDESDISYELFEIYRSLPPSDRTFANVSRRKYGNENTANIREYSKKYNWNQRVVDWDNHLTAQRDRITIEALEDAKSEYQETARASRIALTKPLQAFAKKINNGDNFDSMSLKELYKMIEKLPDKLKRLQEIEFTALGHATEITKQDITSNGKTITINLIDE